MLKDRQLENIQYKCGLDIAEVIRSWEPDCIKQGVPIISSGGNLLTEQLVFIEGPSRNSGKEDESEYLQKAVTEAIKTYSSFRSVTIPFTTTPYQNFSSRLYAMNVIDSIFDFLDTNWNKIFIKEINITTSVAIQFESYYTFFSEKIMKNIKEDKVR